jgi:kynurenine formamidase
MQIRSFIVAYALVLAILLFADRRPGSAQQDRYSHVVDLTEGQNPPTLQASATESRTHIIAPGALIPGTWNAGQIPPERLIAPLVVIDVNAKPESQISLDDISTWESHHGMIPQGAVVALRRENASQTQPAAQPDTPLPIETPVSFSSDRALARQIALHGSYVVEGAARFTSLPATGALVIVAPAKNKKPGEVPVRVLAMVR